MPSLLVTKPTLSEPNLLANQLYYGDPGCGPGQVTIGVDASDPAGVAGVRLYLRLVDKSGHGTTSWSNLAMSQSGGGWSITINPTSNIPNYSAYSNAWVQFYFVATSTRDGVTQSPSYTNNLSLSRCIIVR